VDTARGKWRRVQTYLSQVHSHRQRCESYSSRCPRTLSLPVDAVADHSQRRRRIGRRRRRGCRSTYSCRCLSNAVHSCRLQHTRRPRMKTQPTAGTAVYTVQLSRPRPRTVATACRLLLVQAPETRNCEMLLGAGWRRRRQNVKLDQMTRVSGHCELTFVSINTPMPTQLNVSRPVAFKVKASDHIKTRSKQVIYFDAKAHTSTLHC